MLAIISQAIPGVVDRGDSLVGHPTSSVHTVERERETAPRQAWDKNILVSGPRTIFQGPFGKRVKYSSPYYQRSIRGA